MKRVIRHLGPLLGFALFMLALWVLHHQLNNYHYHQIIGHLRSFSSRHLFLGLGLTLLNYLPMSGYNFLALHYVHHRLPYRKIAMASFVGYAFSNYIGLSMLAGASVRYRLYSAWGLTADEITKVVAFCTLARWLGFLTLGGVLFLLEPTVIPGMHLFPFATVRPFGMIFLSLAGGYFLWSLLRKRPLKIRDWDLPIPSRGLVFFQVSLCAASRLFPGRKRKLSAGIWIPGLSGLFL
jgi:phosphatidylglycerol lysyltransferase